jgi:hypothetical protein
MVVKSSKHLEGIYDSLENLLQYFSSVDCSHVSPSVLSLVQNTLLKLENELRLTTDNYKPHKRDV